MTDKDGESIQRLLRGQFIVKSVEHSKPFAIVTDDLPVTRDVSDLEILGMLRQKFPELFMPEITQQQVTAKASSAASALLLDVARHPFRNVSKRFKILDFSGAKGETAKQELVAKGLVEERKVKIGKYKPNYFLVPTAEGLSYLRLVNENTKAWDFIAYHVSLEHKVIQVLVKSAFEELGYATQTESPSRRSRVDLLVITPDGNIAVEIVLSAKVQLPKLSTLLREVDQILILCADESAK